MLKGRAKEDYQRKYMKEYMRDYRLRRQVVKTPEMTGVKTSMDLAAAWKDAHPEPDRYGHPKTVAEYNSFEIPSWKERQDRDPELDADGNVIPDS